MMDTFELRCYVSVFSVLLLFCLVPVANRIKEIEFTVALGSDIKNIMAAFTQIEETETLEDTNVLKKLQKILTPGLKNQTSSSSSSESYSGSLSQSSSSSESLESSSSSSESSRQTLVSWSFFKCATMKNHKVWRKENSCAHLCVCCRRRIRSISIPMR